MQQPENNDNATVNYLEKIDLQRLIRSTFSQDDLKRVCEMHESEFGDRYDMTKVMIPERQGQKTWRGQPPNDYYYFQDNGSDILAVAHLDTVIDHEYRTCTFVETEAGQVVFSGALDDRLGAYVILELLPALGIKHDILLTIGEESGESTADYFEPPEGKEYNWMIEFDRGDTDVVMYQYDDEDMRKLIRESGARPGSGSFSDIAFLEHLEIKGFNWGVAYQDYHGPRGHAWLEDTFSMIGYYLNFWALNKETYLPHEYSSYYRRGGSGGSYGGWGTYDSWSSEDFYPEVCLECGHNIRESTYTPGQWRDSRENPVCDQSIDGQHTPDIPDYERKNVEAVDVVWDDEELEDEERDPMWDLEDEDEDDLPKGA